MRQNPNQSESNRLPELMGEIVAKCQSDEKIIDLSYGLKDPVSFSSIQKRLQPNIQQLKFFDTADNVFLPQYLQDVSMNEQSFTKILAEINIIVISDQLNVYFLDIFQTGVLFTFQKQARLLGVSIQHAPLQFFSSKSYVISLLFENEIVCFMAQNQISDQLMMQVNDEQIVYSDVSEPPMFRFQELFTLQISQNAACIIGGCGRTFVGTHRGAVLELIFESSANAVLKQQSKYIPLFNDFVIVKQSVKQMVIDESRSVLYTLGFQGQINAFMLFEKGKPCFKGIKSQVGNSDIVSITPISNYESYVCYLVGIDCYGSESFFTLNDQQPYQHIDLRQIDDTTFLLLKPLMADRYRPNIQNSNFQKIFRSSGVSMLVNPHHVFGRIVDQSNNLKNMVEIEEEINILLQDEIVFDLAEISGQKLIAQYPTAEVQMDCGNFSTRQFVSPNRFFVVLTSKRIILLYIKKPYEIFNELLEQLHATQAYDIIAAVYGQQEALLMLMFLAAIYKSQIGIPQQILSKKCCNVIMNSYNSAEEQDLQQIRQTHNSKAFDLLQQKISQGQMEDIFAVILQLISRLVYSIITYRFYYIPYLHINKELSQYSANNFEIPLKQCKMLESMSSYVQPYITFNYIQWFNLGVMLNDFQQFLYAMQSKLDVAAKPQATQGAYNPYLYKQLGKNLLISEVASSLKYIKELVFFFSLAFNLQNVNKIIPEFLEMAKTISSESKQSQKSIDLPIFSKGIQKQEMLFRNTLLENRAINFNAFQYILCDCFQFKWFLEVKNKQYMEKLVRRLNILGSDQQVNMTRTKSIMVQRDFQDEFKQLCEILSQVYGTRLSALQQLEQASLPSTSALMKKQYISQAIKSLSQNQKSLMPISPLVNLFVKCDQTSELINLVLKCKFKQNDFYIRNVMEVLRSAEVQQKLALQYNTNVDNGVQNFNSVYQSQQLLWTVETDDSVTSPFSFQTMLTVLDGQFFDETLLQNQQIALQQQYRNTQFNVNLNNIGSQAMPGYGKIGRMSSSDFEEFKEFVKTIFNIIEQQYLFAGFNRMLKDQQVSNLQQSEFKTRGLSIILACVKGSFVEIWHNEFYQFLYWHYYNSYCIIEAMSSQDQKNINKIQLQCFELVKRRCVEALLSIQSPFIAQFLQRTDHELYLRYLDRAGQQIQFIKVVHDLISRGSQQQLQNQSIKPNTLVNNRWERRDLNFNQISFLIQNTYHKLSGNQDIAGVNASQFGANSIYQLNSSTFIDQQQVIQNIPEQDINNYLNFFNRQSELCKIQQEMITRLRKFDKRDPGQDLLALQTTLLSCQQLDTILKRNTSFDLSLILQYNSIQVQPGHEFLQNTWRAMLANDATENGFKQDLELVLKVISRTKLDSQQLVLPIKLLIEKFAGCFNTRTAHFAQLFVSALYNNREQQFQYIGKPTLAAVSVCMDFNHKPVQVEIAGYLVVQLLEQKAAFKNWALDDQAVSSTQAKQRIARVCSSCCQDLVSKLRV